MIKYFCDKCGIELSESEIHYCNEMIGYGHFCSEHMPEHDQYSKVWIYREKEL
jgi:hypothetical protein